LLYPCFVFDPERRRKDATFLGYVQGFYAIKNAFSAKLVRNAAKCVRIIAKIVVPLLRRSKKHFIMEEFRVDPRVTTPEARAMYIEQGRKLFALNQTIPFTPENIAAVMEELEF
jgi:hypothetical protein